MKTINCKKGFVNMKGEEMTSAETGKPIEMGPIIANVLAGKTSNPSMAWKLGRKLATEDEVDLLAEEVVFIKDEVSKLAIKEDGWLSGILGAQILETLDSKETSESVDKSAKKK